MNLTEFIQSLGAGDYVAIAVAFATLVEITPIKINPLSWLARKIGAAVNHDVIDRMDKMDKRFDTIDAEIEQIKYDATERDTVERRVRVLRFGDELLHSVKHSKENFDQVMRDIDSYETFCNEHPDFKNNNTLITINLIKKTYEKSLAHNDFL